MRAGVDAPRRPEQLEQVVLRVAPGRVGELVRERADPERVRDVEHRAKPADADVRQRFTVLAPDVRDGIRNIDHTLAQLAVARVPDIRLKRRRNRREHAAVKPGDGAAPRIQRRLEMLGGDRVVVVVVDLVLAGPRHFDRSADGPREQRGLHDIVGLRLAAEAPAEKCHVHLDPVDRDPERLGDLVARPLRVLGACPRFAASIGDAGRRGRWLHGGVRDVGSVIVGFEDARWGGQRRQRIALVAHDLPRSARRLFELGLVGSRIVGSIRPVVPRSTELAAALDGRPRVARNDGDASQRLKA